MEVTQKLKNTFFHQLQLKAQSKLKNNIYKSKSPNQFNQNKKSDQQQDIINKQSQMHQQFYIQTKNNNVQQSQNYLQQFFKSKQHVFPNIDVQLINQKIKMLQKLFLTLNQKTDIKAYLLQYYPLSLFFKNIITQLQHYSMAIITTDDKKNILKKQFYIGQIQENKKHGYGFLVIAYYFNNNHPQIQSKAQNKNKEFLIQFYEGSFNNDKKHGFGRQYKNNSYYIGRFVNENQTSKLAVVLYKNYDLYVGEISNSLKNGFGFLYISSKNNQAQNQFFLNNNFQLYKQVLISKWCDNQPKDSNNLVNFFPTKIISSNYIYEGQVYYKGQTEEFIKNGKGRQVYLQGDAYEGQFKDNRLHGQGKYIWKNGNCYIGSFQNGLRHGQGYWKQKSTLDQYEGKYKFNKREGEGFYKWGNGNFYFGQFKQNLRHGKGKMQWTSGQIYNGYWENGFQNGKGQIWLRQGVQIRFVKEGQFLNGIQLQRVNNSINKAQIKSKKKKKSQDKQIELLTDKKQIKFDHKKHKSQFTSSLDNRMPKIKKYFNLHTEPIEEIINHKSFKKKSRTLGKNINLRQSLMIETLKEKEKQDHNKTKKILYKPTKIKIYTEISESKNLTESQQIGQNKICFKNPSKQIARLPKIEPQNLNNIFKKETKNQVSEQQKQTIIYSQTYISDQYKDLKKPLKWKEINRKHYFCYKTKEFIQK